MLLGGENSETRTYRDNDGMYSTLSERTRMELGKQMLPLKGYLHQRSDGRFKPAVNPTI